jgi:hypothetical protein
MKKRDVLVSIVGIALIFIILTNQPSISQEDRRHSPPMTSIAGNMTSAGGAMNNSTGGIMVAGTSNMTNATK